MAQAVAFDVAVSKWVQQTQQRMQAVFQQSAQQVIEEMQTPVGAGGNMPVVTGFLRASLLVTLGSGEGFSVTNNPGKSTVNWDGSYVLMIANAKIGDMITAVYVANYARRVEEGFTGMDAAGRSYNQSGRHFVKLAAQRWPTIVRQNCAALKNRVSP